MPHVNNFGYQQSLLSWDSLKSDWTPPKEPPNLSDAKLIAVDTETKDPLLKTKGPGFLRGDAQVLGIAIAVPGASWYFPISHIEDNCEWDVRSFIRDEVSRNRQYVFANAPYDLEALRSENILVRGEWLDIQVAEPLLDEEKAGGYGLDNLGMYYFGTAKNEELLKKAGDMFGIRDVKGELYKLPARFVGPYGQADAELTLRILEEQLKRLEAEELLDVWQMEIDLLPVVQEMRYRGVRVDLEKTEQLKILWRQKEQEHLDQITERVDIWSPTDLAALCRKLDISPPLTPKGNPSFKNDWLMYQENPIFQHIGRARKYNKMVRDFLDGMILDYHINGRLHCSYHTMRKDDKGTRSGRLSTTSPALQTVPARDPEFGPAIRSLFLPEEGEQWLCGDYASQEPRITVHYAKLANCEGADELVSKYLENPDTDLHQEVAEALSVARRLAKGINLGMIYGMGKEKMARELGLLEEEAEPLFASYHERFPMFKRLSKKAMQAARSRGYVKTLSGRRRRFPPSASVDLTYKALNSIIQGSAADMCKKAMIDLYRGMGKVPLISVHDELDFSIEHDRREAIDIANAMENAYELVVPSKVDFHTGNNWAEAKG